MNIRQNQNGFTLLEVIIALLLFSIAIMALVLYLQTGTKVQQGNSFRLEAIHLAEDRMEEIKAMKFADIRALQPKVSEAPAPGFSRDVEVSTSLVNSNLLEIKITISWGADHYVLTNQIFKNE